MNKRRIAVIGAGVGGLATAARLAHRGFEVVVFEKTDDIGGRNREFKVGECTYDSGPTLMMMLEPFDRFFKDLGERMEDHLEIKLCDPSYRTFFSDGTRIDGTPNVAQMVRQIETVAGREDAENYATMLGDLGSLYRDSIPNFVRRNWDNPVQAFTPKSLNIVLKRGMLGNLYKGISKYVKDERLRMLFSFQSMYLGLSPFDAPWVYAVLTYMEYGEGIWYPKGGVVEIARAIGRLAEQRGAQIRLNTSVCKVDGTSVLLEDGRRETFDHVVINADLPHAKPALKGQKISSKLRYSCSTFMIYADYVGDLAGLEHHNVFFGKDFKGNLDAIFHRMERPDDPAFYVCISSKSDPTRAAEGHANLFFLVPCANLDRPWNDEEAAALRETVFRRLEKETDFDRSRIVAERHYTPQDWATDLNLERGAAFGLSHDFWQSAFFRPKNWDAKDPGTTYVGASTAPGNGLPMVLISAELAEERVLRAVPS